jgi:NAD(P)-dependent dehydrogenase (short-subunit alcohol dehydrogenase family)
MASTIGGRAGKTVYAASKGAVDVFTVGLAKEVAAEKVSAFSVRPGVTITDMTEKLLSNPENATKIKSSIASQEMANPLDIAEPVIDLISGRFAYASGSLINLGGGGFVF